ncbi:MAG: hypothetical protein ACUVTD_06670 [Nitrososphaerales archaeon]
MVTEGAIRAASEFNLSSWDCYLIKLAEELDIPRIYSVDEELARKVKSVEVVNPIPKDLMDDYHKFIEESL